MDSQFPILLPAYNLLLLLSILMLKSFLICQWKTHSDWLLCLFDISPCLGGHFLTVWHHKVFQINLEILLPAVELDISPVSYDAFWQRTVFRNQNLATGCAHLLLGCHCSPFFSMGQTRSMCSVGLHLCSQMQLTLEQCGDQGYRPLHSQKSPYDLTPTKFNSLADC